VPDKTFLGKFLRIWAILFEKSYGDISPYNLEYNFKNLPGQSKIYKVPFEYDA
jgi:hypothetical protein